MYQLIIVYYHYFDEILEFKTLDECIFSINSVATISRTPDNIKEIKIKYPYKAI